LTSKRLRGCLVVNFFSVVAVISVVVVEATPERHDDADDTNDRNDTESAELIQESAVDLQPDDENNIEDDATVTDIFTLLFALYRVNLSK